MLDLDRTTSAYERPETENSLSEKQRGMRPLEWRGVVKAIRGGCNAGAQLGAGEQALLPEPKSEPAQVQIQLSDEEGSWEVGKEEDGGEDGERHADKFRSGVHPGLAGGVVKMYSMCYMWSLIIYCCKMLF